MINLRSLTDCYDKIVAASLYFSLRKKQRESHEWDAFYQETRLVAPLDTARPIKEIAEDIQKKFSSSARLLIFCTTEFDAWLPRYVERQRAILSIARQEAQLRAGDELAAEGELVQSSIDTACCWMRQAVRMDAIIEMNSDEEALFATPDWEKEVQRQAGLDHQLIEVLQKVYPEAEAEVVAEAQLLTEVETEETVH